jgi:hypothetical protein
MTRADLRLSNLARANGIVTEAIDLAEALAGPRSDDERQSACLLVNPELFGRAQVVASRPTEIGEIIRKRWRFVLVHARTSDHVSNSLVAALSSGNVRGVVKEDYAASYKIPAPIRSPCGALAGLTFGPAFADDVALDIASDQFDSMVLLGGAALLGVCSDVRCEVVFLAGSEVADLVAPDDRLRVDVYFSRVIVPTIALRHIFGDRCWQPRECHATLIIDDPALWRRFGFLRFDPVLRMLDRYEFHLSVAFIPYNYRRSTASIARMFRERPDRLSLCYHGNDHTAGEFTSGDVASLNSSLRTATLRMKSHQAKTHVRHDDVMVFPQGGYSTQALTALRCNNFVGAINSGGYPQDTPNSLTVADVIAPAVTKYGGFPVFFRRYVREFPSTEIAMYRFLGKPLLIGEHHEIFKEPGALTALVASIRSVAPDVRWANPESVLERAVLYRRTATGTTAVRAFATRATLHNERAERQEFEVEWQHIPVSDIDHVQVDGERGPHCAEVERVTCVCAIEPESTRSVRLLSKNELGTGARHGFRQSARVFARRRLSEFRDMHLSRSGSLLVAAETIRRRVLTRF